MKIKRVEIQGFRAYKYIEDGTFDFTVSDGKPSNFVAIYAPNGFGKSSFYDAVEWAITGHLDRLGGDHNKQNHELAARSTKKQGEAQKILRNKDVDKDVTTCVNVLTTLTQPFTQTLKKIRSDSRDLTIGSPKDPKNSYFRQVLLSQDEISRFLREAKPQERYERFMESFGGDVEVFRKELTALIYENNAMTAALKKTRDELQIKIDEPVNLSVFEQFNEIATRVNTEQAFVPLIDSSFSEERGGQLRAILITRSHELKSILDNVSLSRSALVSQLADIAEIQLNLELIAEKTPRLTKLKKSVIDAEQIKQLANTHEKFLDELNVINSKLQEISDVIASAELFLKNHSAIADARAKEVLLSKYHAVEFSAMQSLEELFRKTEVDIAAADSRISDLRAASHECPKIYSEIDHHQVRVDELSVQIAGRDVAIGLEKAQRNIIEDELTRLSSIKITAPYLLTSDVTTININLDKVEELSVLSRNLLDLDLHAKSIVKTQNALTEQMGVHEKLISTGLEYISLWPTPTCPLCQNSYDSPSALRNKLESTNLLSDLSKENANKLEISKKMKFEFESRMADIVKEAVDAQMAQIAEFRTRLNAAGQSITAKERERADAVAEKQGIVERIISLQESVFKLSKDDFLLQTESNIQSLTAKRNEDLASKNKLADEVSAKRSMVREYTSSIKANDSEISIFSSDPSYRKVAEYVTRNAILPAELKENCLKSAKGLEKLREERKAECQEIQVKSRLLQENMLADGNWIDFQVLVAQKEKVQEEILRSESLVASFFESVSRTIGQQIGKSLTEIRAKLSESIDTIDLAQQASSRQGEDIALLSELLKAATPYLAHLSLRKELTDVEEDIDRHHRVDNALTKDRDVVVEELKTLIKEFFHEELINSIYKKIDPHPSFRNVEFRPDFDTADRPGLNIVLIEDGGVIVSPILYFSTAQLNILSLSVFLAGALHAKDDRGTPLDVIMIDDPIQSMDSINTLATIDLLRSISIGLNKQIIISTHDDNFFGLLQRKIPSDILGSKFLRLEKFGRVVTV